MKAVVQVVTKHWRPNPVQPPEVDPKFDQMNGLQRATESFRYVLLRWEQWASPGGDIREWLRHNTRVGAWLLIPALFVMPAIGLILLQLTGWLAMLTSIAGRLIVLPMMILLAFVVIRVVMTFIKR